MYWYLGVGILFIWILLVLDAITHIATIISLVLASPRTFFYTVSFRRTSIREYSNLAFKVFDPPRFVFPFCLIRN